MPEKRRRRAVAERALYPVGREAALILRLIRTRAAEAFCGSTAAELAGRTGSTVERTSRILDHLRHTGWIAGDGVRSRWWPTDYLGLLHRFGAVVDTMRGLAALDARTLPADARPLVADARGLLVDAEHENRGVAAAAGRTFPADRPPMARPAGLDGRWRARRVAESLGMAE